MKKILIVTYVLLAGAVISAFVLNRMIWAVDAVVLGAFLCVIYLLRGPLNLTGFLFSLIASLVVLHCYAVFGFFKMQFFGLEYDTYIHFYSGMLIAMVAFHYVVKFKAGIIETALFGLLLALGVGLFNELVEFAGFKIFGEGEGLFLLGPGDIGATNAFENLMTDFFNDFYGNTAGIVLSVLYTVRKRKKKNLPD